MMRLLVLVALTCLLRMPTVRGEEEVLQQEVKNSRAPKVFHVPTGSSTTTLLKQEIKNSRAPRLFYVSTASSTTTLLSHTTCFVSSAAAPVTCGRRKRFIDMDSPASSELTDQINPLRTFEIESPEPGHELDASKVEPVSQSSREGKFLVYWLTTTSLSTLTSYTRTITVASLSCTPTGYDKSECGK